MAFSYVWKGSRSLRITCCPFPPKMYAELRTDRGPGSLNAIAPAKHTTTYPDHQSSEGGCQYSCECRPGETEARHVFKSISNMTAGTGKPRTHPRSREPPHSSSGAKRFYILLFIQVQSKSVSRTCQACQYKLQSTLYTEYLLATSPKHAPSQWSHNTCIS